MNVSYCGHDYYLDEEAFRRLFAQQPISITLPKVVDGQIGWYLDSPSNRHIQGDGWIARDWMPVAVELKDK